MKAKEQKRSVIKKAATLVCTLAVLGGLLPLGGVAAKADTILYERDFETLTTAATADDIYGASGVAGANRSIVEETENYIQMNYTFYESNNCQVSALYLDQMRSVTTTTVGKTYTFEFKFQTYGLVDVVNVLFHTTDNGINHGAYTFRNDGTAVVGNYGSNQSFLALESYSRDESGWWTVKANVQGYGGWIYPQFCMNTTDAATANAQLNTGIRLSKFTVTEDTTTVYNMAVTGGLSGELAVFGACGFAGGGTNMFTAGGDGIEGKSVKAVYDFWSTADGGWQKEGLYLNEGWINVNMEAGKKYRVEFEAEGFGSFENMIAIFAQIGHDTDSQVIMKRDGSYSVVEYKSVKMFDSYEVTKNGATFHVNMVLNGLGGQFKLFFNMNSSDADGANTRKDTGLYFDNIAISEVKKPDAEIFAEQTFAMIDGAQVRMANPTGLRFSALYAKEYVEYWTAEGYEVEMGMLIAPTQFITAEKGALTLENTNYVLDKDYKKIVCEECSVFGDNYRLNGVLKVAENHYDVAFTGIAYVKLTKDGVTMVKYATGTENSRSIKAVAAAALEANKTNVTLSEEQVAVLEKIVG